MTGQKPRGRAADRAPRMHAAGILTAAVLLLCAAAAFGGSLKSCADVYFIGGAPHRYFSAGDAAVVKLPGGKTLGIDFVTDTFVPYHKETGSSAEHLLREYGRLGIDRLDYIVISHWHGDHAGGLKYIVEKGFDIRGAVVFVPDVKTMERLAQSGKPAYGQPNRLYPETVKMLREQGCRIVCPGDGDKVYLSGASLTFWNNDMEYLGLNGDYNNFSLVCALDYGGQRVLFTGDIGPEAQRHIAPRMSKAQVLKSMHHSWTPIDKGFMEAVSPDMVVSMDGNAHDKYIYEPKSEIQPWAEEHQVPHYRTNINGAIGVRLSRKGVSLLTDSKPFVR